MKRLRMNPKAWLSAALSVLMLMSSVAAFPASAQLLGDVDGSGTLNMMDAMLLFSHTSGTSTLGSDQLALCDLDGSGAVNMMDASLLYQVASGNYILPDVEEPVQAIDLMQYDNVEVSNATVTELEEGGWLIQASGASSIGIVGPGAYDAQALQYLHIVIESNVPFRVSFYDETNDKWMTSTGDFSGDANFGAPLNDMTKSGAYSEALWINGCYTWDGSELPAEVQLSSIYIETAQAGNVGVAHMCLSSEANCTCDIPEVTVPPTTIGELVTYTVGSAEGVAVGDTVTLDLSVTENHRMVNGQLFVEYDPAVLELQPVVEDEDNPYFEYNDKVFKNAMCMTSAEDTGMVKFAFASSNEKGATAGGVMFSLTFKVIAEASEGTAVVLTVPEMKSNDGESNDGNDYNTYYEIVNGMVTTA